MPAVKVGAHREVQLPDVVTKRLRIREGAKLEVHETGEVELIEVLEVNKHEYR
jgi:bifunctional DNA-binding transcriptional regulator/antitoxin component of YhaV-PrlF toxin-antitoxin module